MQTAGIVVILIVFGLWVYAKWIKSQTLRKIEREGNERAADDVRAVMEIKENVEKLDKDDAADELDAMRKRLSGDSSSDS